MTMLTISEAIKQRRSIRRFKPDPVPAEAIKEMLEAARLAPSGSNRQPWRFIVVTNAEEKKKLRKICLDQAFVEDAPAVFICCADLMAYSKESRWQREQEFRESGVIQSLSGSFADLEFRTLMLNLPDPDMMAYLTTAVANTYIAIEHMVLTATALGLATCWVGATGSPGEIASLFGLPETTVVVAALPTGYPAQSPPSRPRIKLDEILLRPLKE
jgi:nitroreductase